MEERVFQEAKVPLVCRAQMVLKGIKGKKEWRGKKASRA